MEINFFFDCFRGNLVAGAEDDKILDSSDDSPLSRTIHFALVPRAKPSVSQHFRRLLRTVPIAWKNIGTTHNDLIVLAEPHFNPRDSRSNTPRDDMMRIIHRTDARGFGQSIDLQDRDAADPQINAFKFSPTIFLRIAGKTSASASQSHTASVDSDLFSLRRRRAALA